MAIFYASLNHSYSGRKKKKLPRGRKAKPVFKPYVPSDTYRRETPEYKSVDSMACATYKATEDFRKDISAKYTVAPAYNKGAYQVISRENIKDIGK